MQARVRLFLAVLSLSIMAASSGCGGGETSTPVQTARESVERRAQQARENLEEEKQEARGAAEEAREEAKEIAAKNHRASKKPAP
jgi:hypothetical protein